MIPWALSLLALAFPVQEARTGPVRAGGDDVNPGLVASYRSRSEKGGTLERVDEKPAFTLGTSSPHPRIAPGPFEVAWKGVVRLLDEDDITFGAYLGGEVEVAIDGDTVLKGKGETASAWIDGETPLRRKPGLYRIRITYRSLADVPARLQIWWEGATFSREPLPAWQLMHLVAETPPGVETERMHERARRAIDRLGCARCHAQAFPGIEPVRPGPSLKNAGDRMSLGWLLQWLENPGRVKHDARMPVLFASDRNGFLERWAVSEYLLSHREGGEQEAAGDHRMGKRYFLTMGCLACHYVPDEDVEEQVDLGQIPYGGLVDRGTPKSISEFLRNPHARYPDGRMPQIPLSERQARDIAAYLLLWSKTTVPKIKLAAPRAEELDALTRKLGARNVADAGRKLMERKNCLQCHSGFGELEPARIPIRDPVEGCMSPDDLPRIAVGPGDPASIMHYLQVSSREKHPSTFEEGKRLIGRLRCFRCHTKDRSQPPLEEASSRIAGAYMQWVPFMRTPRLANPLSKYRREYLEAALRNGVKGVRHGRYSWKMPIFGDRADAILRALAAADGDLAGAPEPPVPPPEDPTLFPLGPELVGFGGYSCVSCHVWKGKRLSEGDPGAVGPEMTTVAGRIRKDWFDRWLEDPARIHPGTPMPQIFPKGKPAKIQSLLGGDAAKQRDALWAYLLKGVDAPSPKPRPPIPISAGNGPLVAQIPIRLPDKTLVESICVLFEGHDLVVYDVAAGKVRGVYTGAQILRQVRGRVRTYTASGTPVKGLEFPSLEGAFAGYDRLPDGARIRTGSGATAIRLDGRRLSMGDRTTTLPAAKDPEAVGRLDAREPDRLEGALERPGYRAVVYPRPKTSTGEDLIMPGGIAVHPRDGRVFVASMKQGEIFVLDDPEGNGQGARFLDYGGGLFQEAYSMLCESDALYVLHRRNLTRVEDTDGDGRADRFDRVATFPQAVGDAYDYGYGLVRDKSGAFVWTHAPHANRKIPGSGGSLRLVGGKIEELAYGFRNPIGWCVGPDREIFFTDNQGEWVATNKLCRNVKGRFFGYPNRDQNEHTKKPKGSTAIWVPYEWAHSINGVTWADTGGKFGPFDNQIFMAELMFGGAIVRANLEKVNGEYQGACFPFWGRGLLGPLVVAFDPKGRLWVGSITEPGWMAQPDRGALFRIDFTGKTPFEMKSIHVRPQGFRIVFTRPVDPVAAAAAGSYQIDHHRYEYTGAYGSPELDRTPVSVRKVEVAADGRSVELTTDPLVTGRVYMIGAGGVRSPKGEALVHPRGAYTLNEIPKK